jgi:hypothetical protein
VTSADFAFSKPAGVTCRHLDAGSRCGIHDRLLPSGMAGCVAYDCFGAGQRVVELFDGGTGGPSARMLGVYDVVRQLHELLWYADDALSRPAAAAVHPALAAARASIDQAIDAGPDALESSDPADHRAVVAPLLRRTSTLVRDAVAATDPGPPRDRGLAGADLSGADLTGADLAAVDGSMAYLIRADLRGADLRFVDLLGADLRGADLSGADLTGALYLTRTQVGGARGSGSTRLPDRLPHPAHWLRAGSSTS